MLPLLDLLRNQQTRSLCLQRHSLCNIITGGVMMNMSNEFGLVAN